MDELKSILVNFPFLQENRIVETEESIIAEWQSEDGAYFEIEMEKSNPNRLEVMFSKGDIVEHWEIIKK